MMCNLEISIDWKDEDLSPPKHPYQYGKLSPYRDSSIAKSKFTMYYSEAVDRQIKKGQRAQNNIS
jgi:hypothetical protein